MKNKILEDYSTNKSLYENMGEQTLKLFKEILNENKISIHQINYRIKGIESLDEKIDFKQNKYNSIEDITDICGIRIITYLESDVDKIAELLKKEFEIDQHNSVDKRLLETNQFGYRSLHYVMFFNKERKKLLEYKKYSSIKFEVQIRSILQHAWAEIEHDLGYKGDASIPNSIKRNFYRLAALLETADIEFDRLKKEIIEYQSNIDKVITKTPEFVEINQTSLLSLLSSNLIFKKARKIIRINTGCSFKLSNNFETEIERFKLFDISNIAQIENVLKQNEKKYLNFINEFTKNFKYDSLSFGLPLFYMQHFLAAKSENEDFINQYFNFGRRRIMSSDYDNRSASQFIAIYRKALKS